MRGRFRPHPTQKEACTIANRNWVAPNRTLAPLTTDRVITNYLPLPRFLTNQDLSSTALLVYSLLLDRGTLSQKNNWTGPDGTVYVVYPNKELSLDLAKGVSSIKRSLRELEEKGLIRRERSDQGRANHIYLFVPPYTVDLPKKGRPHTAQGTGLPSSDLW